MKKKPVIIILGSNTELAKVCEVTRQRSHNWLVIPPQFHEKVREACRHKVAKIMKAEEVL